MKTSRIPRVLQCLARAPSENVTAGRLLVCPQFTIVDGQLRLADYRSVYTLEVIDEESLPTSSPSKGAEAVPHAGRREDTRLWHAGQVTAAKSLKTLVMAIRRFNSTVWLVRRPCSSMKCCRQPHACIHTRSASSKPLTERTRFLAKGSSQYIPPSGSHRSHS